MLAWNIPTFGGIIPRLRDNQLPKGFSTLAHDVDLTHGTLKSFLIPKVVGTAPPNALHLHSWGCELLTWDTCVSVAEWLPDCPRLFITGRRDYPEVITQDSGILTYRRLGVPSPNIPPTPTTTVTEVTDLHRSVSYITTFVNSFGEEGASSLPSRDLVIEDGQAVELDFRYNPPVEYDIQAIRIYRRETGFNSGLESEQELKTHWFFVDEVPITERSYTDTTLIQGLGWAYEGIEVREPPTALANITAIPDTAILAGSVNNKLLFSKNLQPHNWELSQEMTLDDNVVALGALGNSLYVATDGHPYRVQADVGCDQRECRDIHRYTQAFPMINCHVGHGGIATPFGFVYASTEGLVLLGESPNPTVITSEVLSQDDWRKLQPHTTRLAYHKGALYVVTDSISFILWMDNTTYSDTKYKKMVTISDIPLDMTETRQGELLMLQPTNTIEQWNAGNKLRPYRWTSAIITTGFLFELTRARVKVLSGTTEVGINSDRTTITRRFGVGDMSIPFGRHGRMNTYTLSASGTGEVAEISAGVCDIDMGAPK